MEADFGYEVFEESTTADDDGPTCLYKREGGAEQWPVYVNARYQPSVELETELNEHTGTDHDAIQADRNTHATRRPAGGHANSDRDMHVTLAREKAARAIGADVRAERDGGGSKRKRGEVAGDRGKRGGRKTVHSNRRPTGPTAFYATVLRWSPTMLKEGTRRAVDLPPLVKPPNHYADAATYFASIGLVAEEEARASLTAALLGGRSSLSGKNGIPAATTLTLTGTTPSESGDGLITLHLTASKISPYELNSAMRPGAVFELYQAAAPGQTRRPHDGGERMLAAFAHGAAAYSSARAHAKVLSTAGEKLGGMGVQLWVAERAAVLSVLAEGSLWQVRDLDNLISQQRMAAACSPDGGTRGPPPFLPHVLGVPPPSHVKFLSSDDEEDEETKPRAPSTHSSKPTYDVMVIAALVALKDAKVYAKETGSSMMAVVKHIKANYTVPEASVSEGCTAALKQMVAAGALTKDKALFKLTAKAEAAGRGKEEDTEAEEVEVQLDHLGRPPRLPTRRSERTPVPSAYALGQANAGNGDEEGVEECVEGDGRWARDDAAAHTAAAALNTSQRKALDSFVKTRAGALQLVQGPPGCGKTKLVVAVLHALRARGLRVLLCAPSNKAVTVVVEEYLATGGDAGACALVGVEDTIRNLSAGEAGELGAADVFAFTLCERMHARLQRNVDRLAPLMASACFCSAVRPALTPVQASEAMNKLRIVT